MDVRGGVRGEESVMGQPVGDGLCAHLIALSNQFAAANCAASAIFLIAVSLS